MQMAAGRVAAAVMGFYNQDAPQHREAQAWTSLMYKEHDRLFEQFHATVSGSVHASVAAHVALFPRVRELAEKRKRKLTDVDAYRRQLRHAKEKRRQDPEVVRHKEEKLRAAEGVYARLDRDLTKLCGAYEAYKSTMLNEQLAALAAAQSALFEGVGSQVASQLAPVAEGFASGVDLATSLPAMTAAFVRLLDEDSHTENLGAAAEGNLGVPEPVSPLLVPTAGHHGISGPLARHTERAPFEKPFAQRHQEMAPASDAVSTDRAGTAARGLASESGGSREPAFLGRVKDSMVPPGGDVGVTALEPQPAGFVTAMYDRGEAGEEELDFSYGDVITVVSTDPSGWWYGELNGVRGLFPANYTDAQL